MMADDQKIDIIDNCHIENNINNNCDAIYIIKSFVGIYKPIKLNKIQIGYDMKTKSGKIDWVETIFLSLLLILIAVMFSSLNYINIPNPSFCTKSQEKLSALENTIYNHFHIIEMNYNLTMVEIYVRRYYDIANNSHIGWNKPYIMSEEEDIYLKSLTNLKCSKKECLWGVSLFGINCVTIGYDCPNPEAVARLNNYNEYKLNMLNYSYNSNTTGETIDLSKINSEIINIISTLLYRINIASSLYVCYRAIAIYFTSKKIYQTGVLAKMCNCDISKLSWIIVIVILIYFVTFLIDLFHSLNIMYYLTAIFNNPCLIDTQYMTNAMSIIKQASENITFVNYKYTALINEYKKYQVIDRTYRHSNNPVIVYPVEMPPHEIINNFSETTAFNMLFDESSESNLAIQLFFGRGIFMVMLQPIICEFIMNIFELLFPLSTFAGKIICPENSIEIIDIDKLKRSQRIESVIPIVITGFGIIWIMIYQFL